MADTNGQRDENREVVGMAATNNAAADTKPVLVDPTTGRLLLNVTVASITTPVLNAQTFDDNYESVSIAFDNTDEKPFLIDNRNGFLLVDMITD